MIIANNMYCEYKSILINLKSLVSSLKLKLPPKKLNILKYLFSLKEKSISNIRRANGIAPMISMVT